MKSKFIVTELNPTENWKWAGPFLNLTVHDNHRLEPMSDARCRLLWIVDVEGFGVWLLGRILAPIYKRNLSRAIPGLIGEIGAEAKHRS